MAEELVETTEQEPTPTQPPEPHGDTTDWKAMARKWEAQSKANNERIKELEAKAAKYDEYEASQKSELERAQDGLSKAQADAADWKAKYEAMQAEQERQRTVAEMAAQYKVDAGTLSRMSGDVEENAKYLAGIEAARPKYPTVTDNGDTGKASVTRDEILAEKDTQKRQQLIAENIHLFK
jgi:chromosome segregation ATPase